MWQVEIDNNSFDDTLIPSKIIINSQESIRSIAFQKINLRKLLEAIFIKQMHIFRPQNTKLFLTVSNEIPEIVFGDLEHINKLLQLVIKNCLKSALSFGENDNKLYCKIELIHRINDKKFIVSLFFKVKSSINDNFWELQSINSLAGALKGLVKLNNNQTSSKINIHLPLEVC